MKRFFYLAILLLNFILLFSCRNEETATSDLLQYGSSSSSLIDRVTIVPASLVEKSSYSASPIRHLSVNFEICLMDPQAKQPIKHYDFGVSLETIKRNPYLSANETLNTENRRFTSATTDGRGCLVVDKTIDYNITSYSDWSEYKVKLQDFEGGVYKGIDISRTVYINPHIKNKDFGIDQKRKLPPRTFKISPRIQIPKLTVTHLGDDESSYKMNKYLHLGLDKVFNIHFNPAIKRANSYDGIKPNDLLLIGKYSVRTVVLTPKHSKVKATRKNIVNAIAGKGKNYTILTTSTTKLENEDDSASNLINGLASAELAFPLYHAELSDLANNNILVLEFAPIVDSRVDKSRQSQITPQIVYIPFSYNGFRENFTRVSKSLIHMPQDHNNAHAVTELLRNAIRTRTNTKAFKYFKKSISSYEIYKQEIKKKHVFVSHESEEDTFFTRKEFNIKWQRFREEVVLPQRAYRPVMMPLVLYAANKLYEEKKPEESITHDEMNDLVHNNPSHLTLQKLCKLFIAPPIQYDKHDAKNRATLDQYMFCIENPQKFFSITPTRHTMKVQQDYPVTKVKDEDGVMSIGDTFFIMHNHNFVQEKGDRNIIGINPASFSTRRNLVSSAFKIIKPAAILSALDFGVYLRSETYHVDAHQKVISEVGRNYIDASIKHKYLEQRFEFKASVKKCVLLTSTALANYRIFKKEKVFHMCKDNDEKQVMTENFYYLTGKRSSAPYDSGARVIRGSDNFQLLKNVEEQKGRIILLNKVKDTKITGRFQQYLKQGPVDSTSLDKGNGSFPGLILPYYQNSIIQQNKTEFLAPFPYSDYLEKWANR
ncbi:MAG: hypothetical protein ISR65_01020 [Bacteriovoracaceae bacterium]|nr:hypothetical protein [Bacteriovoracaceae bacterium]